MSSPLFGWPNWSDPGLLHRPTLSGGSWVPTLPLANIQSRHLSQVARSTDALAASTMFDVDLGIARPVGLIALVIPNLTVAGKVRARGSNTAGVFTSPAYDSTLATVLDPAETDETLEGLKPTFVRTPSTPPAARYWRIEISDAANPDGYVDIARLFIADAWDPSNVSYGATLGLETESERVITDGGPAVYNERPVRRTANLEMRLLPDSEAIPDAFELQRRAGTTRQLFFVFNPDDPAFYMQRRAFPGVLRALTALEAVFLNKNSIPFQVTEDL